jgi:hypothetical protein
MLDGTLLELDHRVQLRIVCTVLVLSATAAHAEVRGTLRLGILPLELDASSSTPLFGGDLDRAVTSYNTAAAAYNRAHGTSMAMIKTRDLSMSETLLTLTPGLEVGGDTFFFRLEGELGTSSNLRELGLGLYPLNVQKRWGGDTSIYGSVGGFASMLSRSDTNALGALVGARLAGGVRFARYMTVELGFTPIALGGVVDRDKIDELEAMRTVPATLPTPSSVVSAGDTSGMVDVSVGVTF